jgi:nucleoside-diphosphate-sugar epimerase
VRTLVTGATGRIGSRFVPRLLERGDEVRALVRDPARARSQQESGAEVVVGDLCDSDTVRRAVEGRDAVVHLAAAFRGVSDEETAAVNERASLELARAAFAAGVARFVFASTNLVYGSGRNRPAREDDRLEPVGAYPASKAAAEEGLRVLRDRDGLGLRIVRFAFVYGERDPHLAESLMWARDWPTHKRMHLVHHADVAQALIRALRADGIDGWIFNAADDAPVTALELLELNREQPAEDAEERVLDDPWEGIVDTTTIRERLGFRPIYPTVYAAREAGAL